MIDQNQMATASDADPGNQKVLIAVLLIVLFVEFARRLSKWVTLTEVPGPVPESWLLGHGYELHKAPVGTKYNVWAKEYGPTYKLRGPLGVSTTTFVHATVSDISFIERGTSRR